MEKLRLDPVQGHKWAKMNDEIGLLEFFTCVSSGYFKQEDYTLVTDEYAEQYIAENYPHEEEPETEPETIDASTLDSSVL